MKTPEQIRKWLSGQSWFDKFKSNVDRENGASGHVLKGISEIIGQRLSNAVLEGILGVDTMRKAFSWDDSPEGFRFWSAKDAEFNGWYLTEEMGDRWFSARTVLVDEPGKGELRARYKGRERCGFPLLTVARDAKSEESFAEVRLKSDEDFTLLVGALCEMMDADAALTGAIVSAALSACAKNPPLMRRTERLLAEIRAALRRERTEDED